MDKDNEINPKIVETYAEDMAKVIEDDKGGLVKKIIHGEEENEKEKRNLSPESKKNKFFIWTSFVLILAAIGALSFFIFNKNVAQTVPIEQQFTPLVFNDKSAYFEIKGFNKDEIAQTVLKEATTTQVKKGGLEGIYLTENKQIIGLRRFIFLMKSNFIPGDNTLFVNDDFLLGMVKNDTGNDINDTNIDAQVGAPIETAPALQNSGIFILLKMRTLSDIFDPLRAWEDKMFPDLHGIFGIDLTADNGYLLTKNFEDGIVQNKNARILYDKDSNIVLMYVFADDNSVIITDSESTAGEVMLRLASSQIKK